MEITKINNRIQMKYSVSENYQEIGMYEVEGNDDSLIIEVEVFANENDMPKVELVLLDDSITLTTQELFMLQVMAVSDNFTKLVQFANDKMVEWKRNNLKKLHTKEYINDMLSNRTLTEEDKNTLLQAQEVLSKL